MQGVGYNDIRKAVRVQGRGVDWGVESCYRHCCQLQCSWQESRRLHSHWGVHTHSHWCYKSHWHFCSYECSATTEWESRHHWGPGFPTAAAAAFWCSSKTRGEWMASSLVLPTHLRPRLRAELSMNQVSGFLFLLIDLEEASQELFVKRTALVCRRGHGFLLTTREMLGKNCNKAEVGVMEVSATCHATYL